MFMRSQKKRHGSTFQIQNFIAKQTGSSTQSQKCNADAIFGLAIMVYTSQQNVKGAVNDALNEAVPKAYCRNPNVIRVKEFRPNNDLRQIIVSLTTCYWQNTTVEVNKQDNSRRVDWNTSQLTEELINCLEEYFIFTLHHLYATSLHPGTTHREGPHSSQKDWPLTRSSGGMGRVRGRKQKMA